MSNSELKHFRLVTLDEVMRLPHRAAMFVLCFDCDGLMVKIATSRYPRQRIVTFFQQAAQCQEIWLFNGESHFLDAMCRYIRDLFEDRHIRAGYIRIPMAEIDRAIGEFLTAHNNVAPEAIRQAA